MELSDETIGNAYQTLTGIFQTNEGQSKTRKIMARAAKRKMPGGKIIEHNVLLGYYNFFDIYESPNEETSAIIFNDQFIQRSFSGRKFI